MEANILSESWKGFLWTVGTKYVWLIKMENWYRWKIQNQKVAHSSSGLLRHCFLRDSQYLSSRGYLTHSRCSVKLPFLSLEYFIVRQLPNQIVFWEGPVEFKLPIQRIQPPFLEREGSRTGEGDVGWGDVDLGVLTPGLSGSQYGVYLYDLSIIYFLPAYVWKPWPHLVVLFWEVLEILESGAYLDWEPVLGLHLFLVLSCILGLLPGCHEMTALLTTPSRHCVLPHHRPRNNVCSGPWTVTSEIWIKIKKSFFPSVIYLSSEKWTQYVNVLCKYTFYKYVNVCTLICVHAGWVSCIWNAWEQKYFRLWNYFHLGIFA
jgi:hypothetical protein